MRAAAGRARLTWTRDEQLHFTLAFLGEQPESALAALESAGLEAARACASFDLSLAAAGAFPDPRRPRVLWLGAQEGAAALTALAEALRTALQVRGFSLEERP